MLFYLPGVQYYEQLNKIFIETVYSLPHHQLKFNNIIFGAYGKIGPSYWYGGINHYNDYWSVREVKSKFTMYENLSVRILMDCSNILLDEKDLNDSYNNMILKELDAGSHEVLVYSPMLTNYIANKYPSIVLVGSQKLTLQNPDFCLEKPFSKIEYSNQLPANVPYIGRIKNLNNKCHNCEQAKQMECLLKEDVRIYDFYKQTNYDKCLNYTENLWQVPFSDLYDQSINKNETTSYMLPFHFSIERQLYDYIHYIIKPEYQDEVFLMILMKLQGA